MYAKGSNLGNTSRQIPQNSSSFVPMLPQKRGFDLSHQYEGNQVGFSMDWRKHPSISYYRRLIRNKIDAILSSGLYYDQPIQQASDVANILEDWLFIDAASEEEYMNEETLIQRFQTQLDEVFGTKFMSTSQTVPSSGLLHAWSNGSLPELAFQVADPIINATDYCSMTVNNNYGYPNGGLSHPSVDHEPVFSPDNYSPITTCGDMDLFPDFPVSDGGYNLEASSKSNCSYFPLQLANDCIIWEMEMLKYRGYSRTIQKNDSMAFHTESSNLLQPQHLSREISDVSKLFPGQTSSSSLGDIRQYELFSGQTSIQQNFEHFRQQYELRGKASMAQPSSCFVDQGEHCCQMLGKKPLTQPQLPTRHLNRDELFISECSAGPFSLDGSEYVNSCNLQYNLEFPNSMSMDFVARNKRDHSGNSEAKLPPSKRLKMNSAFSVSLVVNRSSDNWTHKMVKPHSPEELPNLQQQSSSDDSNPKLDSISQMKTHDTSEPIFSSETISSKDLEVINISDDEPEPNMHTLCNYTIAADNEGIQDKIRFNQEALINATKKFIKPDDSIPMLDSLSIGQMKTDDTSIPIFNSEIISSEDLEVVNISDELDPNMHNLCNDTIAADNKGIEDRTGFNQEAGINATEKVIEPKADQQMETKSSNATVNIVSLTEIFTSDQIKEHIMSLRKQFIQNTSEEETGVLANTCNLCSMQKHFLEPVPIYCLCCGIRIKRNAYYYYKTAEEFDTENCFCTLCYKNSRGGQITFNGVSVSKTLLDRKRNDEEIEEAWVQCNKCKRWQHQICALYNNERDLDCGAEYICPICRLKDIENGVHVPLPKTAIFCAKDLPSTMLSDHLEKRLFRRLLQEREDRAKVEGNVNFDEVLAAESLTVRVVLSVDKQLKVKNEFQDIILEENYPTEFPYRSKVILLFQQIEGVDVCLFGMYVQEFGSECGYPNQRCVYISHLDSVKYFTPERETISGEALRTFVYHELLIGYLDFCKKRGFTTCYIWACPPLKGEDYLLYCHPGNQKTPKNDKLRQWYHSMLRKAADENIVVGLSNIYDRFFVPTEKCDFKVTAAHLPYFDGDYWSGAAMDQARNIEQESGGQYERALKKVTKRALKSMGHENPSKGTAKDILVMQKVGQTILPVKEDFIVVHLQYECMHCHEVLVSGRRWFCTECKKFQECERCHTAGSHSSVSGERHTLCQVLVDDIPSDTKENDIILNNELFEIRHNFLSFCQKNHFQFDTLRRAKYSSMMILHHLNDPALLTVGTICSICCDNNVFQQSWKCEICPAFTICSTCYEKRGANCHTHKLSQTCSTAQCGSGNQEQQQNPLWMQELLQVLQHASQCCPTKAQPCSYPNCIKIKKLFSHCSKCTIRVSGGCQYCKKAWLGLTAHSRNCRDSKCSVPRCKDLKKHAEMQNG